MDKAPQMLERADTVGSCNAEQHHNVNWCVVCYKCTGAAVDYTEGFVGCMRALQVNGEMMDLKGKVKSGEVTYGVAQGQPTCSDLLFALPRHTSKH